MILPLKKANERIQSLKDDSDMSFFMNLMYSGEQLLKIIVATMVAGIEDSMGSRDHDQYYQNYKLVRADSIGVWSQVLDDITLGPAYHLLSEDFRPVFQEVNEKVVNPSWQYGAVVSINKCLQVLNDTQEEIQIKSQLRHWFKLFVQLRNEARAHGVLNIDDATKICSNLEVSIKLISENFLLFKRPWVFIKRNISGSYRFTNLSDVKISDQMKDYISSSSFEDGIYIILKKPFKINIIESTAEAIDFFLPNGNFKEKTYECLSYISGNKLYKESRPFLKPLGQLPTSETQGKGKLDLINNVFTNLPNLQTLYITRNKLEIELEELLLMEDKYPVITLSGRGGIGKTTLALHVLRKICRTNRYDAIVWLSARDIDLLDEGPKTVKPQILDEADIATEFCLLLEPEGFRLKSFDKKKFIETELKESSNNTNGKILFVMDNFETLKNPLQVYKWLDTYIRNPNKILITSRLRDFKADYPITVEGMSRDEFNELVESVSIKLDIQKLLNKKFMDELYKESDGHPYVVKVMLGEVSSQKELKNVKRVIASKDDILTALFERTYSNLHPSAKKVFLTLCGWRNILPEIAVEAVLNREDNEFIDIEAAIEELSKYSLIEIIKSNADKAIFISVTISAYEFGKKKLSVSPLKSKIYLDIEILKLFGITQFTDIDRGLKSRIEYFFRQIAIQVSNDYKLLGKFLPLIEFIARKYPYGWIFLANLYYESNNVQKAIEVLQNYVSDYRPTSLEKLKAWEFLSRLFSYLRDYTGEAHAYAEICKLEDIDSNDLSNSVNSLMNLIKTKKQNFKKEEINILLEDVADRMKDRITFESTINKYTELAWVYVTLNKKDLAKELTLTALQRDSNYYHAINLAKILKIKPNEYS